MTTKDFCDQLRKLIAKDELEVAIKQLSTLLKNSPQLDEVIVQSARLNEVKKQIRLGLVDFDNADLSKNRVRITWRSPIIN